MPMACGDVMRARRDERRTATRARGCAREGEGTTGRDAGRRVCAERGRTRKDAEGSLRSLIHFIRLIHSFVILRSTRGCRLKRRR